MTEKYLVHLRVHCGTDRVTIPTNVATENFTPSGNASSGECKLLQWEWFLYVSPVFPYHWMDPLAAGEYFTVDLSEPDYDSPAG